MIVLISLWKSRITEALFGCDGSVLLSIQRPFQKEEKVIVTAEKVTQWNGTIATKQGLLLC